MKNKKVAGFSTRAIGQTSDGEYGAVIEPISLSTNFVYDDIEKERGSHSYIRYSNPTREALEVRMKDLENAKHGFAFSSGAAAMDSVMRTLKSGDHVIFGGMIYGGTIKLIQNVYQKTLDISFDIVDPSDINNLKAALKPNTKIVWLESPSNPHFNIVDLAGWAKIAQASGALCVVDNTVATPYLQNPLSLGVDVVVHSASKYLGGHSDVLGGIVLTNSADLAERIHSIQTTAGAVLSPFDSYLVLRGIKTLEVRMQRHCENALAVAEMLDSHPAVDVVNYAGLKNHQGHSLAKEQMRSFGGMMSVALKGGKKAVSKLTTKTELFVFAESLGGVESIISHPATMSHALLAGTQYAIDESLVRLSVGIENIEDLLADLQQAL